MGDNNSSLKVSTEELKSFGNYLTSSVTSLNEKLESLSTKMATLDSSWLDKDGTSYIAKFESFINNSKKINTEIDNLGKYALSMGNNYETILSNYLSRM